MEWYGFGVVGSIIYVGLVLDEGERSKILAFVKVEFGVVEFVNPV